MRNPFRTRAATAAANHNNNNNNNNNNNSNNNSNNNDSINPDDNLQDPLESFLGTLGDRAQGLRNSATAAAAAASAAAANASAGFDPEAIRRATEASLRGVQGAGGGYTNAGDNAEQNGQPARGPPPASAKALRELPVVTVNPPDLIDPVNRECCVCYEGHAVGSRVVRLPCAHIFHPSCIGSWLRQRCTCPVCRYELPTSSPEYEQGRVQRMGLRKPRFARHELDRLSIKECKALLQRSRQSRPQQGGAATATASSTTSMPIFCDKSNLIDFLIDSQAVDLIVAPAPVTSYKLSELNRMTIGQLKRCMNDEAGVFFDPKDVIEKSDMVRIFVNSGRLDVIVDTDTDDDDNGGPEEEESKYVNNDDDDVLDRKPAAVGAVHKQSSSSLAKGPIVETVSEDSDDEGSAAGDDPLDAIDNRLDTTIVMEMNADFTAGEEQQEQQNESSQHGTTDTNSDTPIATSDDGNYEDENEARGKRPRFSSDEEEEATSASATTETRNDDYRDDGDDDVNVDVDEEEQEDSTLQARFEGLSVADEEVLADEEELAAEEELANEEDEDDTAAQARFGGLSIAALRALAHEASVDLSGCIERKEMIDRLASSIHYGSAGSSSHGAATSDDGTSTGTRTTRSTSFDDEWNDWGVSEIRTLAALVDVDLSQCNDRDEMIQVLHDESRVRPHVARYLTALIPLARLTVPQLRAVAREWRVDVSDCLEKGDLFHRLVCAGGPTTGA